MRERVRIAWLPEDETTASFWKFLLRILRALNAEYGDEFTLPSPDQLADTPNDGRSIVLIDHLLRSLAGRTLLVVVENLDDVMRGLKDEGQKRWRAFLQEHPIAATLATSQQLTDDVSDRARPFFNFFQIEYLKPLNADEALILLAKIAEHTGNMGLAAFLQTPAGRARVRAIRHIAGGSHRVFIILSEFATRENLDELVTALEELLDELTPYYQERLRWLPDQQREIVEFLCRQAQTVRVKGIARELFLSEQTAAAQLKQLRDKGYVRAESVGRESRYELAEPLMRLCVEVKDPQLEPIRLIVEFLRIWYDKEQVKTKLEGLPRDAIVEREYLRAALQKGGQRASSALVSILKRDLKAAEKRHDPEEIAPVLVELATIADSAADRCFAGHKLSSLGRFMEATTAFDRALELHEECANAWSGRGWANYGLGEFEQALTDFDRAIQHDREEASAWTGKGCALDRLGRAEEALVAVNRGIRLDASCAVTWAAKGAALYALGRHSDALTALEEATRLDPSLGFAWTDKAATLSALGRSIEALVALDRAIELDPADPVARGIRGWILAGLGRLPEALASFERAIELDPEDAIVWNGKGWTLNEQGQATKALPALDRAIELNPRHADTWRNKGQALSLLGRPLEALVALDQVIKLDPEYASAWNDRGQLLYRLGRYEDAIAAFNRAIEVDPHEASAWTNKGHALNEIGRFEEALAACSRAIELQPEDAIVWENRGRAKLGLGQVGKALLDLRHAIELNTDSNALECLAEGLIVAGDWGEAERLLAKRFRFAQSGEQLQRSEHLPDIIAAIFSASTNHETWRRQVGGLVSAANAARDIADADRAVPTRRTNPLMILGDSLVRSLPKKSYSEASAQALDLWSATWHDVASKYSDLSLAARLFGVGVRYLQTSDERALLDLVQEERSILSDLFGLKGGSDGN
ncbi:MAG TPA: tetratricopeptide repeat protein [Gemmataceae bacterium]|nr:tetratricopeptide repeat protein [Gemmataceae bacterium]